MKEFDTKKIYCRKLGHELNFNYCRQEQGNIPCGKIMNCWYDYIDIGAYLKKNFQPDEIKQINQPPANKVVSLLDLIEKAKLSAKTP